MDNVLFIPTKTNYYDDSFQLIVNGLEVGGVIIAPYKDMFSFRIDGNERKPLRPAQFWSVNIQERYRGLGYGSLLMKEAIQFCLDKYDIVFLKVRPDNEKAIALYNKFGFVINGRRGGKNTPYLEMSVTLTKAMRHSLC